MLITGIHYNYYFICHRKLWFYANGLHMEHNSDLVYEGKHIHKSSYSQRNEKFKEIEIEGIKIDYFDHKKKVIHEIKKSNKKEEAHIWQLKHYIYVLAKHGIDGVTGLLEYPKLRRTKHIELSHQDKLYLELLRNKIISIAKGKSCPPPIMDSTCNRCAYRDFCFCGEIE